MLEDTQPRTVQKIVNCYLSAIQAAANSLGEACPEVGGPYRSRLNQLRARLAFDPTPEALEESCGTVENELRDYAAKASSFLGQARSKQKSTIFALDDIIQCLARKQEFYLDRLRQFALQMEATAYPCDPDYLTEIVALQVAGLRSCVEGLARETDALLGRTRSVLSALEQGIREVEITDTLTGLINQRELERLIEIRKASGQQVVLLEFHLTGDVVDEVAQEVASRLSLQFRHQDYLCRWSDADFRVLFAGTPETALARAEQIVPWVAGRYLLDNGESAQIGVEVQLIGNRCPVAAG